MRCRKAETWLLLSMDGRLDASRKCRLQEHLGKCPACAGLKKEYEALLGLLEKESKPEPLPRFWERLSDKLPAENVPNLLLFWERWCLKAIPVVMGAAFAAVVILRLVLPSSQASMTRSEILLLKGQAALIEADVLAGHGKASAKNWELIFASLEDENGAKGINR
jgi:predicted anti-sigma-YlaC factor YlaD